MLWNIVFVGAGGSWLSNLVWILWDLGFYNLIWIDEQESQITQQLQERWVQIFKHWKYQVKPDDAVIYSAATKESPEVLKAFELKSRSINHSWFGIIFNSYEKWLNISRV